MKFLLILLSSFYAHSETLKVGLVEKSSNRGHIAISIFKSGKGFPTSPEFAVYKSFIAVKKFPISINLPQGEYAVSVFHDTNGNRELDTNFVGIPKEAFGFSNDVLGLMGPPSFEAAKFEIKKNLHNVNIKLKRF